MRHTVQIHYLCSHAWNQHNFTLQAKDAQNIQKICASLRWNMRWNEWWSYFGCSCNNIYHVIIIILFFFFRMRLRLCCWCQCCQTKFVCYYGYVRFICLCLYVTYSKMRSLSLHSNLKVRSKKEVEKSQMWRKLAIKSNKRTCKQQ